MRDPSLWKTDDKHRAAPGMIPGGDGSALSCDYGPAQSQAYSVSGGAGILPPVKPVKKVWKVFFFEACSAVMNCDFRKNGIVLTMDINFSVIACAFHTVFEDVLKGFRQPVEIPFYGYSGWYIGLQRDIMKIHGDQKRLECGSN